MLRSTKHFPILQTLLLTFLLSSCTPAVPLPASSLSVETTPVPETSYPNASAQVPTPQAAGMGPAVNPLTGLPVEDPSLLQFPALLVSISNFPVEARPQAGLSFAPYVFEIYITEGATRFLTTFYGEFPAPEVPLTGGCEVRREPFRQANLILGNRVWHDENENGIQETWENGIGGVCVNLYDADGTLLQQTATDSNGYYGFNTVKRKYFIEFVRPQDMEFVPKGAGEGGKDSDVDPSTGRTDTLDITTSLLDVDAGLIPLTMPSSSASLPPPKVGPVRSGRLIYADIAGFFPDSCLIYAGASPEVLVHLPQCAFVEHDVQGGGYMLGIPELIQLARDSQKPDRLVDYTSNVYSIDPPPGGAPASRLHSYIAWLNQSAWVYDASAQSWWRLVDDTSEANAGSLHPEIDRLTGRQLQFENVIVLFTKHDVVSPTNLDIHLEQDWLGDALLFRDGKKYDIRWSTVPTEEEYQSGRRKPIRFFYPDERTLFPLKPGKTWIIVVTLDTVVTRGPQGEWLLQFVQPPGAK